MVLMERLTMRIDIIILSASILSAAMIVSYTIYRLRLTVRRSILTLRDEYRSLRKLLEKIESQ
jgi:hypothetical protein